MKRLLMFWKLSSEQKKGNPLLFILTVLACVVLCAACQVRVDSTLGNYVLPGSQADITVTQDQTALSHDSTAFDFGLATVTKDFTITNSGGQDLSIYSVFLVQSGTSFSIDTSGVSDTLAAEGTTTFSVTYTPATSTRVTGSVTIVSNALDKEQFEVTILGGGPTLDFSLVQNTGYHLSGEGYDFGYKTSGSSTVLTFQNDESFIVEVANAAAGTDFSAGTPSVSTVEPGDSTGINITFSPNAGSSSSADLTISDVFGRTCTVKLMGTALQQPNDPSLADDLALWLDAEKIRSTDLKSGTQAVERWKDQSGRFTDGRFDAVSIASLEPDYIEDGINGRPGVEFKDGFDVMRVNGQIFPDTTSITLFLVFTSSIAPADARPLYGTGFTYLRLWSANGGRYIFSPSGMSEDLRDTGLGAGTEQLFMALYDSTLATAADRLQLFVNGSYVVPTAATNPTLNLTRNLQDLLIGNYVTNPVTATYGLNGIITELIYYTKTLDAGEITLVNDYLNDKYGLW